MITASKLAAENGSARGSPRRSSVRAVDLVVQALACAAKVLAGGDEHDRAALTRLARTGTTAIGASPALQRARRQVPRRAPCRARCRAPRSPATCPAPPGGVAALARCAAPATRLSSRSSASAGSAGPAIRVDRTNSPEARCRRAGNRSSAARVRDSSPACSQSTFERRDTRGWLCPRTAAMSDTDNSRLPAVRQDSQPRGFSRGSQQVHQLPRCFITCLYNQVINQRQARASFTNLFD